MTGTMTKEERKMAKKEQQETQENTSMVTLLADNPMQRPDWLPDVARGSEDVTQDDITLPRVEVVQALSPQIKRNDPAYLPGAEQGMIFNTVSGELYGNEVVIVPIMFRREFILWQDRDKGGGFGGSFPSENEAEIGRQQMDSPDDYEITEHHVNFVYVLRADGTAEEAVLSWAKSKMKCSRRLNALVQMSGTDRFARAYKLTAVETKGKKGEYWTFNITQLGFVAKPLWERAGKLFDAIKAGERAVSYGTHADDAEEFADATV